MKLFNESASNVKEILKKENVKRADYIISGIPFSHFDKKLRNKILRATKGILNTDGKFFAYQCSWILKKYLDRNFDSVKLGFEPLNIPPLFIFEAVK